jgi:DNA gyrase subunit B
MAFLNRGLQIGLRDEREPRILDADQAGVEEESGVLRSVIYRYEGGIVDFVAHLNSTKGASNPSIISFGGEDLENQLAVEVAMQWNQGFNESVYTFANTINTVGGGTHEEGFRTALTSLINKFAREWGVLKDKQANLSGEDIREGLTAIVSLKLGEPQFEGQTKGKLGNTEAKTYVQKMVNDHLGAWFEANPAEGKSIARKSADAAAARLAARKARDLARNRKGLLGGAGLPGKLIDCSSREPEACEIFIVEGDSAGGSARSGRDPQIQAILPIRGKILNVEKARMDRTLNNNEVQAIVSALGAGVKEEFEPEKLRYHKIVLMADADVDGQHIRTLLLTFLFRFMPELIEGGYVYLAQPPLYKIDWSQGEVQFAYTDRERDALLTQGKSEGRKLRRGGEVQRYKGLGEMNANELWETTMDPQRRLMLQVDIDSAAEADEIFSQLMGEDVEARRRFIQDNAADVRFLDV